MFFAFRQNNSGGTWIIDEAKGISVNVIVEAKNADEASARAQDIGLYFDGCASGADCPCCGDRWYDPSDFDKTGDDVPMIYQQAVKKDDEYIKDPFSKWAKEGVAEGFIHYLDGRVEGFWQNTRKG